MQVPFLSLHDVTAMHGEEIRKAACRVIDSGWYLQGKENETFERHYAEYYMNKFAEARRDDTEFRRCFDREMIYRLYQYLFIPEYAGTAKQLAKQIDYSLQKKSMKWRMKWPYLYRLYLIIVGREYRQF